MIKFSWQGDINTDFNRKSKYVDIVREALDDLDVKSVWNKFPVDFTFCSPTDTFFSTIDHFLASQSLEDIIKDAGVIHLGDNVSGHSPIYLKLNNGSLPAHQEQARVFSAKQNWKKATNDDNNVNCSDITHRVNIDGYTIDIIKCL